MNNQEASRFVEKVFTEMWCAFNPAKIAEFYQPDMSGNMFGHDITLADVKNRLDFISKTSSRLTIVTLDVFASDNKIAFRQKQTLFPKDGQAPVVYNMMGIYQLRDGKISRIWGLADQSVDYKEKA